MATHKRVDRLCAAAMVLTLALTVLFMNGKRLGIQAASQVVGYETRLFSTSKVHTLDIVMDDWESFIASCENEEYAACAVVIDGEAYKNVAIRAKGNTSLSMVPALDSSRYSFKLEFDHYDSGITYHGLDKLSLNNLIQDSTYMKDYLVYRMMGDFGVAAPLCSYVSITVNGEPWGLYLAVEGVEDAFLQRSYGKDGGALYKPDSQSFGGGRGNGRDFSIGGLLQDGSPDAAPPAFPEVGALPDTPAAPPEGAPPQEGENGGGPGNFGGGGPGMGSDDVKLRYIDDDPASYANIFDNAKTDVNEADQARLIEALRTLSGDGRDPAGAVDVEAVLRYFVVHNFVCNGDSYTGSIVHNYYLHEKDGRLSMIPWDYNLAFGTFQGQDASSAVNEAIDSPVSSGDSRPMLDWIFASEAYTDMYHQYFANFLDSVDFAGMIAETAALIAPYVEEDATAFYSYEEFQAGVEALTAFCALRAESVARQLDGRLSPTDGDRDGTGLVDASELTLSDMGTMEGGMRGPGRAKMPEGGAAAPVGGTPGAERGETAPASGTPGAERGAEVPDSGGEGPERGTDIPASGANAPSNGTASQNNAADRPAPGAEPPTGNETPAEDSAAAPPGRGGGMARPGGGPGWPGADAPGAETPSGTLSGPSLVLFAASLLGLLLGILAVRRVRRWH